MYRIGLCKRRVVFLLDTAEHLVIRPTMRLCFYLCWFLCQQANSKSFRRILTSFFGGVGCVKRLDFDGDPDHVDLGFLKGILRLRKFTCKNFADNSISKLSMNSYEIFEGVRMSSSNKPFDFGSDPDHDSDPGIFQRNIYHCGTG